MSTRLTLYYEDGRELALSSVEGFGRDDVSAFLDAIDAQGDRRRPRSVVMRGLTTGAVIQTRGLRMAVVTQTDDA